MSVILRCLLFNMSPNKRFHWTNIYRPNFNLHFLGTGIEVVKPYHLATEFGTLKPQDLHLHFHLWIFVLCTWNHVYTVAGFSTSWNLVFVSSKIWFCQFLRSFLQVKHSHDTPSKRMKTRGVKLPWRSKTSSYGNTDYI